MITFLEAKNDPVRNCTGYHFNVQLITTDPGEALKIAFGMPITELPAVHDLFIIQEMKEDITRCIKSGTPFMPVIDMTSYPEVIAYIDTRPAEDGTDQFSKDVLMAYGKMKVWVENADSDCELDYTGIYYIVVNLHCSFTGLKFIPQELAEQKHPQHQHSTS